ncbi:MAG: MATE family efflux transporter [Bacteroidales bacterium]|nr:MATE family efflux transporter [Bacteroidales bacterium]
MGQAVKRTSIDPHEKYVRMTTLPVGKLVTEMAVPSIVSMLVSGIYNLADTFFIGQINTQSVAAMGIVYAYMVLIQSMAIFFGQGSGNYISRALGRRETVDAEEMAAVGLGSSVLTGIILAGVSFLAMRPILSLLGSTETIMPYACEYFSFILIGTPFIMGTFTLNNQMRHQGNAMLSMIGIVSGAVLNIVLDPILIFGFDLGIRGAGMATAISQFIGFIVILSMVGKRGSLPLRFHHFKPTLRRYRDISAGGLPSLARQGLMSLSAICLNQLASNYGDVAIAAFSIVSRIMMLACAAMIGYGQGFQPVCGFNYGAGLFDRVRKAFWHSCSISTVYCFVLALLGWVFAGPLVALFRADDPEVIRIGSEILRFQCYSFPLTGFIVLANMYLQNIRRTIPAIIMASARQGIFFLPALYIGHALWGFTGMEISQMLADICSFLFAVPVVLHALKAMEHQPIAR